MKKVLRHMKVGGGGPERTEREQSSVRPRHRASSEDVKALIGGVLAAKDPKETIIVLTEVERKEEQKDQNERVWKASKHASASARYFLALTLSSTDKDKHSVRLNLFKLKPSTAAAASSASGSLAARSVAVATLKKRKDLTHLERLDVHTNSDVFSITLSHKTSHWACVSTTVRDEFCWWIIQACRNYLGVTPPSNMDMLDLDRITVTLTEAFTAGAPGGVGLTEPQQTILGQKAAGVSLAADAGAAAETVKIPSATHEETELIEHFLGLLNLPLADIGQLEDKLHEQLKELESTNMAALETPEAFEQRETVSKVMQSDVRDLVGGIEKWMDDEANLSLKKMRAGVQTIEQKNKRLEIQERNLQQLEDCIKQLLGNLEVSPSADALLTQPDFTNRKDKTLEAAEQLVMACKWKLSDGLDEMAAVRQLRSHNETLKTRFSSEASRFLSSHFVEVAASLEKKRPHKEAKLDFDVQYHQQLEEYAELARTLEDLNPKKFVSLRSKYTAAFAKPCTRRLKAYFQQLKDIISKDKKASSLASFPVYIHGAALGLARRGNTRRHLPGSTDSIASSAQQAMQMQGRIPVTDAYARALGVLAPFLQQEQTFCLNFFGHREEKESEAPSSSSANAGASRPESMSTRRPSSSLKVELAYLAKHHDVDYRNRLEVRSMLDSLFPTLNQALKDLCDRADSLDHFNTLVMLVNTDKCLSEYKDCDCLVAALTDVQAHLRILFNRFIDREAKWIDRERPTVKRGGVVPPVGKFPSFVDRMESKVLGRMQAADSAYHKLSSALFQWLEKLARHDLKYMDVLLMENYHFFWKIFSAREPPIPAMEDSTRRAKRRYQKHLQQYILWNVKYEVSIRPIIQYWDKLDDQIKSIRPEDVPFTAGLSKHDLRALTKPGGLLSKECLPSGLEKMFQRISKHLPTNNELVRHVWIVLQNYFLSRFHTFETLVERCYANEKLYVNRDVIRGMFDKFMPVTEQELVEAVEEAASVAAKSRRGSRVPASVISLAALSALHPQQSASASSAGGSGTHTRQSSSETDPHDISELESTSSMSLQPTGVMRLGVPASGSITPISRSNTPSPTPSTHDMGDTAGDDDDQDDDDEKSL